MSLRPLARPLTVSKARVSSQPRRVQPPDQCCSQLAHLRHEYRNATSYQWRRTYAQQIRDSWKEVRDEIDTKRRKATYQLMQMQGVVPTKMQDAEDMFQDFVTNQKIMDSRELVLWLAETYKVPLRRITYLALITYRIPDAVDKTGRAPPSRYKSISRDMLFGCCKAGDLLATLHILGSVLYRDSLDVARELARTFNKTEISTCLHMSGKLADEGHPSAMVIRGLFFEQEGKASQARALYEAALESREDPGLHNEGGRAEEVQITIPTIPPWIALGTLLKESSDAASRDKAKKALERGALEEDDPLAYYHLASFEEKHSANWLTYMSKAAGAGYAEAMFELGTFYQQAGDVKSSSNGINPSLLADTQLAKALNWLQDWRRKGPTDLAVEWFEAGAKQAHKPAMAELINIYEVGGNNEKAMELLENLARTPTSKQEPKEWSTLTQNAIQRFGSATLDMRMKRRR